MRIPRALVAADPLQFGRGPEWLAYMAQERGRAVSDDVQLFAATFAAGFLFVSILIA